jgi:hypothetical protein
MPQISNEYEKTLYFTDAHAPFHDPKCWEIMLEFIRWWKPSTVVNLGDWMDFPQISKFDKDPNRLTKIQEDLDIAVDLQAQLRDAVQPTTDIVFLEGNHDQRWQRYLWSHPEIANLRDIQLPNLLKLDTFNIKWVGILQDFVHNGFLLEHGDRASQQSGYTAKSMLDSRAACGMSGHTHRFGTHHRTSYGGDLMWKEAACMCKRDPHYCKKPNWQNGFEIGYHKPSGRFEMYDIPIVHDKASFNMIEFTGGE